MGSTQYWFKVVKTFEIGDTFSCHCLCNKHCLCCVLTFSLSLSLLSITRSLSLTLLVWIRLDCVSDQAWWILQRNQPEWTAAFSLFPSTPRKLLMKPQQCPWTTFVSLIVKLFYTACVVFEFIWYIPPNKQENVVFSMITISVCII